MPVRYDFYQTDSNIVIEVMLKSAKERNYKVIIEPEKVTMTADDCFLEISLYYAINAEKSSHRATPSKVEITLSKASSERWPALEKKPVVKALPAPAFGGNNWDKLAQEVTEAEKEEAKGEEAFHNLLQKIYNESTDEVRRAMNKSFSESAGTVLSTNWKEVGDGQVKASPPDGTELRKWD